MSISAYTKVGDTCKLSISLPGLGVPGLTIMEGHARPQLIYPFSRTGLFPAYYHVAGGDLEGVLVQVTDIVVHLLSNLSSMSIRGGHEKQPFRLAPHYRNCLILGRNRLIYWGRGGLRNSGWHQSCRCLSWCGGCC